MSERNTINLFSPVSIRSLLTEYKIKPGSSIGQCFLIDKNILSIIIENACISESDHILEIGPGIGVLTRELVKRAGKVTAIELDKKLKPILCHLLGENERLTLIWGDANKFGLASDKMSQFTKLVSNLPYSSASRILAEIVTGRFCPPLMVVMVQMEVAMRITAEEGTPDRGVISVWLQAKYKPTILKKVSRNCFWPKPKVESAVVCLEKLNNPMINSLCEKEYFELTKKFFQFRRKQIGSIVNDMGENFSDVVTNSGLKSTMRPEELSVAEWNCLVENIVMVAKGENRCI